MTWMKVDDQFPDHPKFLGLTDTAVALYFIGLAYCSRHLTDGVVPELAVERMGLKQPKKAAALLVEHDLWHVHERGWEVHDYLDHQRSAAEVQELSEKRAAAGSKGGKAKSKQPGSKLLGKPEAETDAVTEAEADPSTSSSEVPAAGERPDDEWLAAAVDGWAEAYTNDQTGKRQIKDPASYARSLSRKPDPKVLIELERLRSDEPWMTPALAGRFAAGERGVLNLRPVPEPAPIEAGPSLEEIHAHRAEVTA